MNRLIGMLVDSGVVLVEPGEIRAIETATSQKAMRLDSVSFHADGWLWLPLSLVALPSTDNLLYQPGQIIGGRFLYPLDGVVNPGSVLQLRVRNDMPKHARFRGMVYAFG